MNNKIVSVLEKSCIYKEYLLPPISKMVRPKIIAIYIPSIEKLPEDLFDIVLSSLSFYYLICHMVNEQRCKLRLESSFNIESNVESDDISPIPGVFIAILKHNNPYFVFLTLRYIYVTSIHIKQFHL